MSAAERVCDCDEGVQCPNDRKPTFFMEGNLLQSGLVGDVVVLSEIRGWEHVANYSPLMRSRLCLGKGRRHPLVLGATVKRGAQPDAGTSLADLNNSRCGSLIGCYGISEHPFIASDSFCERFS